MCVPKVTVRRSPKCPRTPDRRHLSDLAKPRLSRRVVKGTRINLNEYWTKFQELCEMEIPIVELKPAPVLSITQDELSFIEHFQSLGK